MRKKRLIASLLTVPALIMMVSCSGGGGGNDNDNINANANGNMNGDMNGNGNANANGNMNGNMNGGGGGSGGQSQADTYLFYSGSLYYVDPTNPSSPTKLENQDIKDYFLPLTVTGYDANTNHYQGLHKKYIVYIVNGKIYKANAELSSGTPTPQQVSNITDACEFEENFDEPLSPDDTYALVRTAGNDASCNTTDDKYYLIKLSLSSSDAPTSLGNKMVIDAYSSQETKTVEGFLVQEGNKLYECNTTLSTCNQLKDGVSDIEVIGAYDVNDPKYLINIDGNLYTFDGASKQLSSAPVVSGFGDPVEYIMDNNAIYVWYKQNSSGGVTDIIEKISFNTWNKTTLYNVTRPNLSLEGRPLGVQSLVLAKDYIVFGDVYLDDSNNPKIAIKAISKDDDNVFDVETINPDENPQFIAVYDNRIFYNRLANSGFKYCYLDISSSSTSSNCDGNGYIAGETIGQNGYFTPSDFVTPEKLIIVENCSMDSSNSYCFGGDVYIANPSDMSKNQIGSLPTDIKSFFAFGIGRYLLGQGNTNISDPKYDIFFISVPDSSLTRITNTPSINEQVLF